MADTTWDQTPEGKNVSDAWGYLQTTYTQDLPSYIDQLSTLLGRSL